MFGLKQKKKHQREQKKQDFELVLKGIIDTFHLILRANIYETGFSEEEIEKRLEGKKYLRKALRTCAFGEEHAKIYVKDYIRDILIKKYQITEENIDELIPFGQPARMTAEEKFLIILYLLKKEYQNTALGQFILVNRLSEPKSDKEGLSYYEITEQEIHEIYDSTYHGILNFYDKVCILTQRIYQRFKGNGVIDEIRDMKIDGVSAGVSGVSDVYERNEPGTKKTIPASYESVWIFFRGKTIYLSFLSFGSEKELIRVCKNIYRYGSQGQLSETRGYIVNEMMDGSRVSVARPPFSESWVFFVRKFDSLLQADIHELLTDQNNDLPIHVIKWLIKGCQVTGITGEQGTGKTTMLMSMIRFINPAYNIRVLELSFELHLRKLYPKRNIVTFKETTTTSGQEGLDFQKKTDGTVSILGEVASAPVASWLVQMSMVASRFTLFTHHAKTTYDLVLSLRNALLQEGGFQNERIAEEQVITTVNFDIHMKKAESGHRYIERITEIVPQKETLVTTRDIVVFEDGKYKFVRSFSDKALYRINLNLSKEEQEAFRLELINWRRCCE